MDTKSRESIYGGGSMLLDFDVVLMRRNAARREPERYKSEPANGTTYQAIPITPDTQATANHL
jgi:hypothetical protein